MVTTTRRRGEKEYHAHLLMRSYREGGTVKKETLANLTPLGDEIVALVRAALQGKQVRVIEDAFRTRESRPHGHVRAVLTAMRRLGFERLLASRPSRERSLAVALVARQVLSPSSKLATSRSWQSSTLASEMGVQDASEDELYAAMDWLAVRQERIEGKLAQRHLLDGALVLYDVTSSYLEGERCALAAEGHNRDKKGGKRQIVWGLMTDADGRPIAVEAFPGNTSDVNTLPAQVRKLEDRFALKSFVLVGDRGMISGRHIRAFQAAAAAPAAGAAPADVHWVTALKSASIRRLVAGGALQPSLFDSTNLLNFTHPAYPGERLIACFNPLQAAQRRHKREELLSATLADLASIQARVEAGRLKDPAKIALHVGKVVGRHKMEKHLKLTFGEGRFAYHVNDAKVEAEAALDGIYVLRTSVSQETLADEQVVLTYKRLPHVERAFRTLKSVELQVRPIRHRLEDRVRAHLLLCMLAYYVRWHMQRAWAPITFTDEQPPEGRDPIAPAKRSDAAERKARSHTLPNGQPASSFKTAARRPRHHHPQHPLPERRARRHLHHHHRTQPPTTTGSRPARQHDRVGTTPPPPTNPAPSPGTTKLSPHRSELQPRRVPAWSRGGSD